MINELISYKKKFPAKEYEPITNELVEKIQKFLISTDFRGTRKSILYKWLAELLLFNPKLSYKLSLNENCVESKLLNALFFKKSLETISKSDYNRLFLDNYWGEIIIRHLKTNPKCLNKNVLITLENFYSNNPIKLFELLNIVKKSNLLDDANLLLNNIIEKYYYTSEIRIELMMLFGNAQSKEMSDKEKQLNTKIFLKFILLPDLSKNEALILSEVIVKSENWEILLTHCNRQLEFNCQLFNSDEVKILYANKVLAYLKLSNIDKSYLSHAETVFLDHWKGSSTGFPFAFDLIEVHHLFDNSIDVVKTLCNCFNEDELEYLISENSKFKIIKAKKFDLNEEYASAFELWHEVLREQKGSFAVLKFALWNEFQVNFEVSEEHLNSIKELNTDYSDAFRALNAAENANVFLDIAMQNTLYSKYKDEVFIELREQLVNNLLKSNDLIEVEKIKKEGVLSLLTIKDQIYFHGFRNVQSMIVDNKFDRQKFTDIYEHLLSLDLDDYQLNNLISFYIGAKEKYFHKQLYEKENMRIKYIAYILEWLDIRRYEKRNLNSEDIKTKIRILTS